MMSGVLELMVRHWHVRNGHGPDPGYKVCLGCEHEMKDLLSVILSEYAIVPRAKVQIPDEPTIGTLTRTFDDVSACEQDPLAYHLDEEIENARRVAMESVVRDMRRAICGLSALESASRQEVEDFFDRVLGSDGETEMKIEEARALIMAHYPGAVIGEIKADSDGGGWTANITLDPGDAIVRKVLSIRGGQIKEKR